MSVLLINFPCKSQKAFNYKINVAPNFIAMFKIPSCCAVNYNFMCMIHYRVPISYSFYRQAISHITLKTSMPFYLKY